MLLATLLAAGTVAYGARSVVRARRRADERHAILTPCLGSLRDPRHSRAPDGYPRLSGRIGERRCRLAIIPDTLALRRLPQLWLTLAVSATVPLPSLAITARPRGDDYISKAFDYPHQSDVPDWLPRDVMVRIGGAGDLGALERLRAPLAALFDDPLVKEVSLRQNSLRLVYRLAEGERANHLLLRQCRFSARVDPALFDHLRTQLERLEAAMHEPRLADAA